ncbi:hypothetical protein O181_019310 [Austropuccinia psidii MF-1]|uniref:Uncharacterized protein n=1 Tax=Austropuccinia psidii MF-1 TaxID=1389203 RepID=A0A9Q3CBJ5_9BASI|nr:hypothetical protein [Austropuccinia psidii MF-1]
MQIHLVFVARIIINTPLAIYGNDRLTKYRNSEIHENESCSPGHGDGDGEHECTGHVRITMRKASHGIASEKNMPQTRKPASCYLLYDTIRLKYCTQERLISAIEIIITETKRCDQGFTMNPSKTELVCKDPNGFQMTFETRNCHLNDTSSKDISNFYFKDCTPLSLVSKGRTIPALHPTQYTRKFVNEVLVQAGYYRVNTTKGSSWKDTTEEYKCELSETQVWPVCVLKVHN